ncbi:L-threonylcarbamoyladenylate synthase [Neptunicella marina]|uniref:Threonylcarbamoyl-AMP synthase n=1 Tax=Neptunicella marina TaxID=2125989 RepID=A0A8J6IVF1_9ALTE|nr:threonylcarbamoyl-AMP synthase [Neptunicella marina]
MQSESDPHSVIDVFNQGGIIAYPTEAVFGLGCDPDNSDALQKLLNLKQRPAHKGLILVAADYGQLLPYVNDSAISQDKRFAVFSRWPGPVTWLLPKSDRVLPLLSGESDKIAVRVPAFEPVRELCRQLGKPIVSTSANLSGLEPARTTEELYAQFNDQLDFVVDQPVGGNASPSTIFDAATGQQLR